MRPYGQVVQCATYPCPVPVDYNGRHFLAESFHGRGIRQSNCECGPRSPARTPLPNPLLLFALRECRARRSCWYLHRVFKPSPLSAKWRNSAHQVLFINSTPTESTFVHNETIAAPIPLECKRCELYQSIQQFQKQCGLKSQLPAALCFLPLKSYFRK